MAQRKSIGLQAYFTRSVLLAVAGTMTVLAVSAFVFMLTMALGFIFPANAGELEARAEIERIQEQGVFDTQINPYLYDYIYFDKEGAVIASSLSEEALSSVLERLSDRSAIYAEARYISLADETSALFIWTYRVAFANPVLQALFPDATVILVVLVLAVLVLFFATLTGVMSRTLRRKLSLVEVATTQIAAQDLETPLQTASGIREFDQALLSMDGMRESLHASLVKQWESEQQRKEEIAALSHDLKTPLTVINGNAELLLEGALDDEQEFLARSILVAGSKTQQYVVALQQLSRIDAADKDLEQVEVASLVNDVVATLAPLAKQRQVLLEVLCSNALVPLKVYPFVLTCALMNMGENALRYAPEQTHVVLVVTQTPETTMFSFDDEGPGFSAEAIEHAHEMFWQQDKSRTNRLHCGMGLAIVAKAATLHGGSLVLENTKKGARVTLVIKNEVVG